MKTTLSLLCAAALAPAAFADDYTVFRVCQDQHVIHTSDGAEAGHVEYVVIDPASHAVVSTIVTGGIVGEKFVAVPYASLEFAGDREIRLREITRERFVSSPVIERTRITSVTHVQPTIFEETGRHFGVRFDAAIRLGDRDRRDGDHRDGDRRDGDRRDGDRRDNERGTARTDDGNRDNPGARNPNDPNNRNRPDNDRNRPGNDRRDGRAGTDPNDRDNKQPNASQPNDRNRPDPIGEKTPDRANPKNQPAREASPTQPQSNPNRDKNAADREQGKTVRPGEDVDRDPAAAAEKAEREGAKFNPKSEGANEKARAQAERDALKSVEKPGNTDKPDKSPEKTDRPAGQPAEKSDHPQKNAGDKPEPSKKNTGEKSERPPKKSDNEKRNPKDNDRQ